MFVFNDSCIRNIAEICRICLKESHKSTSLYGKLEESEIIETDITQWVQVLNRILNLPIVTSEQYPTLICTTCIPLILAAYRFKVQYDNSHVILQQYISTLSIQKEGTNNCDININSESGRETSNRQIDKRELNASIEIRVPTRRGRKCKTNFACKTENIQSFKASPIIHPCPICTKLFSALELRKHVHTHKALKKYLNISGECKVDPSVRFYKTINPIDSTYSKLNSNQVKLHTCQECKKQFTASAFRIHIQIHKDKMEFKCRDCPRIFKKLNHLNTHIVQHLKERPFKCEQCGKGFVIQTNYECHILTHNSSHELPHECRYCLKRFSNPEHLNRHLFIHTENISYSVKYKVCKCHRCWKTFKDKTELSFHECVPTEKVINTHYRCKMCNKVFKNANGLYNHNRNTHKLKGAKVLCSVCGNYVSNIYNHMMRHTGERPFECDKCGKRFIGKPQLKQHLLVHSGLKPFVCSICAKAFNNLYNLQVHERIHKGDRCHVCPLCSKGFLEKSYLKKHLSVHTKI